MNEELARALAKAWPDHFKIDFHGDLYWVDAKGTPDHQRFEWCWEKETGAANEMFICYWLEQIAQAEGWGYQLSYGPLFTTPQFHVSIARYFKVDRLGAISSNGETFDWERYEAMASTKLEAFARAMLKAKGA